MRMRAPLPPERCVRSLFWENALANGGVDAVEMGEGEPGFYQYRQARDGPWVAARLWITQEVDEAGELVQPPMLHGEANGQPADPDDLWWWVCRNPITKHRFDYLMALSRYVQAVAPGEALERPRSPVDWLAVPATRRQRRRRK